MGSAVPANRQRRRGVLAALLPRRVLPGCDYFESSASVVMFSGIAGLAAPQVSGLIGASMAWLAFGRPRTPTYLTGSSATGSAR
jgi:hypothetical protein